MLLCLGKPPVRFFWFCCSSNLLLYIHIAVVLHLSFFFVHIFFSTSSLTLRWTIVLHPFYTFSQAHCRVIRDTSIFNQSVIFLPRALRSLVDILYPQAFFTLLSFTDISTCLYQGFPAAGSSSLKF